MRQITAGTGQDQATVYSSAGNPGYGPPLGGAGRRRPAYRGPGRRLRRPAGAHGRHPRHDRRYPGHPAVEAGGGLRTDADLQALLDAGAARAIIGTRALGEFAAELRRLAGKFARAGRGIDARDGDGASQGAGRKRRRYGRCFARAAEAGVQTIIYTDTATDGMLQGGRIIPRWRASAVISPAG